jgi:hypothetical protein
MPDAMALEAACTAYALAVKADPAIQRQGFTVS